jgi:hypothetical protein
VINKPIVGFEVLTAVIIYTPVSWDITGCSPIEVKRRVGGTYLLGLQS